MGIASMLVATCGDPPLAPTFEEPTPVEPARASLLLLPAGGATLGELIAEVTIEVPESGQSVGSFDLWVPGELSEPALIHVDGSLELDDTHVPIAQVLNEGAVAYYLANGDLVYRFVDISFFAVSPGGQLQFQPVGPLEPEGPVVLEDPAAANHGRRVVWWVSEQFSTGFNISDGAPPFCFIIIGFVCHTVTLFETAQGTERPLRGSIQIRAHRVGEGTEEEVEIRIVHAGGRHRDGSFTTAPGENEIMLIAEVTPAALADEVTWEVLPHPDHDVSLTLPDPPDAGVEISFQVPAQDAARWDRNALRDVDPCIDLIPRPEECVGDLTIRSLAFHVVASVEHAGQTDRSEPAPVVQDEIDTIRQEYLDLGRSRIPTPGDLGILESPHFKANELNWGHYSVYWIDPAEFLPRLEAFRETVRRTVVEVRGVPFRGLVLTSGYRNPVHNSFHVVGGVRESRHQYGVAVDIRIWNHESDIDRLAFFEILREAAYDPAHRLCFAPYERPNRAHVDLRGRCPAGW